MSTYVGLGARDGSAKGTGNVDGRLDALDRLRPLRGRRFLDMGCGNGAYTLRVADRFQSGAAIDIEPDRLADARAALGITGVEVLLCSASETPYDDASFDAVVTIETMEHLGPHRDPTVAEAARLLEPGGTLYLTTPNRWWPLEQHGFTLRGRRRPGWQFPFLTWIPLLHRRLSPDDAFTPARLDRIIEPFGFTRSGLSYMFPPLDGHPGLRRIARPILAVVARTPLRRFGQTLVMTYRRT